MEERLQKYLAEAGIASRRKCEELIEQGKVKVNMTLANCSFFVFALHTLIMSDIGKVLFTVFHLPDNTYSMLFMYFVVPTITTLLCVTIYIFLKRFLPDVRKILTGGR